MSNSILDGLMEGLRNLRRRVEHLETLESPAANLGIHHTRHENGGSDEISVAGLSGTLADNQPAAAHDVVGAKHTVTGAANSLVGLTGANALGILVPSSAIGSEIKVPITDANGNFYVPNLVLGSGLMSRPVGAGAAISSANIYAMTHLAKMALLAEVGKTNVKALWFFDEYGASTAILDRGSGGHDLVLSANASALTPQVGGGLPCLNITSNAYWYAADHADFTFIEPAAFSIIVLMNPIALTSVYPIAKYELTTGATQKEWAWSFSSGQKPQFTMYDNSASALIYAYYNASLSGDIGGNHCYVITYDGSASENGIAQYRDGVALAMTAGHTGTYVASEDKAGLVGNFYVGTDGLKAGFGSARYYMVAVVSGVLTAYQAKMLSNFLLALAGGWA